MTARALAVIVAALYASPAAAQRFPQLVKSPHTYVVKSPTGYDIVAMVCVPVSGAASRTVNYSPDMYDPHGPSSVISPNAYCPYYDTGTCDLFTGVCDQPDGFRDYVFNANFGSLWDVRNYDIQCNGYMVKRGRTYYDTSWQTNRDCCNQACQTCLDD